MPTYTYECPTHGEFEEFHSIMIKLEFCPQCEQEGKQESIKRLIDGGVDKGIVKLTGQDLVDKTMADAKKLERDASKNSNLYANMIGESRYNDMQTRLDRRGK